MTTTARTYHVIPHTHWDREWYLSYDHFRVHLVHLIDDLCTLLDQDPSYRSFTLDGQTSILDDYLTVRPEARQRLKRLISEGRIHVGPWYTLPDGHLISGEATIRNLKRGRQMARAFGRSMDVGYMPDTFGHVAQMPHILRGFGIETAIAWRGFGGEAGQEPSEYRWRSPGGSEVLMEHLSDVGYSAAYFHTRDADAAQERAQDFIRRVDPRATTRHHLMLSGGDHHHPSPHLPAVLKVLNDRLGPVREFLQSDLGTFMAALVAEVDWERLPTIDGEMREGYRWAFNVTGGVYSTRMYLKQANSRAQRLLERHLEPLNVLALVHGGRNQYSLIERGWTYLLQNHPHDSICGCSIDPVHREMMTRFEKLFELGQGVTRFALLDLLPADEGLGDDTRAIYLWNPSPFARRDVVDVAVSFFHQQVVVGLNPDVSVAPPVPPVAGFKLETRDGAPVAYEVLGHSIDYHTALHRYDYPTQTLAEVFRLRLRAPTLAGLSMTPILVRRHDDATPTLAEHADGPREHAIVRAHATLSVDPMGAYWYHDAALGDPVGPLGYFVDEADAGDEYNWSPPRGGVAAWDSRASAPLSITRVGTPLRPGLAVKRRWMVPAGLTPDEYQRSEACVALEITTTAWWPVGSAAIVFETTIDNQAKDHRLRMAFDLGIPGPTHRADVQFATISRRARAVDPADHQIEVPAAVAPTQRAIHLDGNGRHLSLLTDGLPEYEHVYDTDGRVLVTLLRCVSELGKDNLIMRPGGQGGWRNATPEAQCQGVHSFRCALLPRPSEHLGTAYIEAVESFLHPILPYPSRAPADVPHTIIGGWQVDGPIELSALYATQTDGPYMMRLVNPSADAASGTITLPHQATRTAVDFDDVPTGETTPSARLHNVSLPPFTVVTYRFDPVET